MKLCYSREVANWTATQELPNILWNPTVHCRVHKSPPPIITLSQTSLLHTTLCYLSNIHFNIIRPLTPWSSYWPPSFWFSNQYPACIPIKSIRATCPADLILLHLLILLILGKIYKL
jgi:hypothetical protein